MAKNWCNGRRVPGFQEVESFKTAADGTIYCVRCRTLGQNNGKVDWRDGTRACGAHALNCFKQRNHGKKIVASCSYEATGSTGTTGATNMAKAKSTATRLKELEASNAKLQEGYAAAEKTISTLRDVVGSIWSNSNPQPSATTTSKEAEPEGGSGLIIVIVLAVLFLAMD